MNPVLQNTITQQRPESDQYYMTCSSIFMTKLIENTSIHPLLNNMYTHMHLEVVLLLEQM